MTFIRWHIFKALSYVGWAICPEPHKSRLQSMMLTWSDYDNELTAALEGDLTAFVKQQNEGRS